MVKKSLLFLILISFLFLTPIFSASIKSDIQSIIDSYEKAEFEKCNSLIQKSQAENHEEKAIVFYYTIMLTSDVETAKTNLQALIDAYPKTHYSQMALLELGNLFLLDREYDRALSFYNKVTEPDISEKHFWIANVYFQKGDYSNAIASGNQYLRLSKPSQKQEDIYYLIADSYINLNQYNNAINTLKKLLTYPDRIQEEQYLRYRYGYASELLGNKLEALSQYQQGYELDRFSQLAYLIEDRLFEMRAKYGASIDLSFLYPYTASPLPDIVLAEQNKTDKVMEPVNPDTTSAVKDLVPKEIDVTKQQGLFLQAGRFSMQNNAFKLCERIIGLGLVAQYYKSTQFKDVSWVVLVGPYQTQLEAINAKNLLTENGIDSFIIQM